MQNGAQSIRTRAPHCTWGSCRQLGASGQVGARAHTHPRERQPGVRGPRGANQTGQSHPAALHPPVLFSRTLLPGPQRSVSPVPEAPGLADWARQATQVGRVHPAGCDAPRPAGHQIPQSLGVPIIFSSYSGLVGFPSFSVACRTLPSPAQPPWKVAQDWPAPPSP